MNEVRLCGCIPGEFLCPVAQNLASELSYAEMFGTYAEYSYARDRYDSHIENVRTIQQSLDLKA